MSARPEASRFAGFIVTGGIAAGVNVASRYALSLAMNYEAAVAIAYLFGMTTAYLLARRFVFTQSGRSWISEYGRFALVNVASFAQVWLVSVGLAKLLFPALHVTWHAEDIAHVIGVASPIVLSYYLHKNFSFRQEPSAASMSPCTHPANESSRLNASAVCLPLPLAGEGRGEGGIPCRSFGAGGPPSPNPLPPAGEGFAAADHANPKLF